MEVMGILDITVARLNNYRGLMTSPVRLRDFLTDATYKNDNERLREMQSKEDRDMIKQILPCIMVSVYSDSRAQGSALTFLRLICLDFDFAGNPTIKNWIEFVQRLKV